AKTLALAFPFPLEDGVACAGPSNWGHLSEGARPYCLLDWQGAQVPSGGLVISSSFLMQLRVDEK
ncbi:MAG: hypothetical protein ACK559_29545, partial [bacterium]